jgi:hypothetical protein
MTDLRYPIGPFEQADPKTSNRRQEFLAQIANLPRLLRAATGALSAEQLNTPYRPGGWTIRQVVHDLADCHLNWYVRTKLALTEDEPTIKPYAEDRWAELEEARQGPIEPSLLLLDGLHTRWVRLFELLSETSNPCRKKPPRIAPRSLFDVSVGDDNLFRGDKRKWSLRLTAVNVTDKYALYNFLSTFSGTHYVTPRTITAEIGFHF